MASLLDGKGEYMNLAALGKLSITVTPTADNPKIMKVDIGCDNRMDVISMTTNMDENVDQFSSRVRSMLRSLHNGQPRDYKYAAPAAKF